jgi:hypothetical protein
MEAREAISDKVERFENFCIKKHALERDIEVVFAKRDARAVMDIAVAERELESTKRECEGLSVRVTKARHGDFDMTQGHRLPSQYVSTASTAPVQLSEVTVFRTTSGSQVTLKYRSMFPPQISKIVQPVPRLSLVNLPTPCSRSPYPWKPRPTLKRIQTPISEPKTI